MNKAKILSVAVLMISVFFLQCTDFAVQNKTDDPAFSKGDHGGKPGETDNMRGDEFGDLYVVLRNIDGKPDLVPAIGEKDEWTEKPVPVAFVWDGVTKDDEGAPVLAEDPAYSGEGFPAEVAGFDNNWAGYYTFGTEGVIEYDEVTGDMLTYNDRAPTSVELGRKNIARSPQSVLDNALKEAFKTLEGNFPLTIDYCGRLAGKLDGNPAGENKTIDSPRENMALYQALMLNGGISGPFMGTETVTPGFELNTKLNNLIAVHGFHWLDIAASCFAAAADKTDNLTVDEIVYVNQFLGINGEEDSKVYNHYVGYSYNRDRYNGRNIHVKYINDGAADEYLTITQAEGVYFFFTKKYNWTTNIAAFRTAADDAMQTLEFIHDEDSIVDWLGF